MALGHFQSHALNGYAPISGATVTVTNELTGGLATLKSDYAGATPKSNGAGFVTDLDGYFDFFTSGGFYKIVVEKDGASKTWRYVPIGTLQGYDIEALLNFKRVTVRAATTANITISTALNNGDSLDGLTLATDDLVLVKDQTTKSQNGIYKTAASPARATGYDAWNDYVGLLVAVSSGTANANTLWIGTNNAGGVLGTNDIVFTKLTVAGGNAPIDSPAFTGSFQWTGDISPTSLSADQDDYSPTGLSGAAVIRHSASAEVALLGAAGGADGRIIIDANVSDYRIRAEGERASSTAANRFARDVSIDPGDAALRVYDATSNRWRWVAPRKRPLHLHAQPDPFPTVPHKPTVYANWAAMPWLDPYFTFTRSGAAASYLDRKGILRYAPAGVPRFHTIYATGESGLLIEGSRTNLLTRSEELDHSDWTKTNTTISANAVAAPDGATTADKIQEDNTSNAHLATRSFSGTNGTTYVCSIYLKAAERGFALVGLNDIFAAFTTIQVNLSTGAVTTGTGSPVGAFSEALPGGWWRVGFSLAATSTGTGRLLVYTSTDGVWANRVYTGTTGSGIYAWGAQVEAGAFPSSYIPTTSATVTRSADSLTRSFADAGIDTAGYWLYAEAVKLYRDASANSHLFGVSNGSLTDRASVYIGSAAERGLSVTTASVSQATFTHATSYTYGTAVKLAASVALNSFRLSSAGSAATPDTSGTMPAVTRFDVGQIGGLSHANALIKVIAAGLNPLITDAHLNAMAP